MQNKQISGTVLGIVVGVVVLIAIVGGVIYLSRQKPAADAAAMQQEKSQRIAPGAPGAAQQ